MHWSAEPCAAWPTETADWLVWGRSWLLLLLINSHRTLKRLWKIPGVKPLLPGVPSGIIQNPSVVRSIQMQLTLPCACREVGVVPDLVMSGAIAHLDNLYVDWTR
jgi:hypothetical protein